MRGGEQAVLALLAPPTTTFFAVFSLSTTLVVSASVGRLRSGFPSRAKSAFSMWSFTVFFSITACHTAHASLIWPSSVVSFDCMPVTPAFGIWSTHRLNSSTFSWKLSSFPKIFCSSAVAFSRSTPVGSFDPASRSTPGTSRCVVAVMFAIFSAAELQTRTCQQRRQQTIGSSSSSGWTSCSWLSTSTAALVAFILRSPTFAQPSKSQRLGSLPPSRSASSHPVPSRNVLTFRPFLRISSYFPTSRF
mmetsp:Transcript_23455/g.59326  ORF Transcript_23455/g.59326 Transcript_23455/m.59326 type:complete len:247 (+) Transcript_23455:2295-3035(+)